MVSEATPLNSCLPSPAPVADRPRLIDAGGWWRGRYWVLVLTPVPIVVVLVWYVGNAVRIASKPTIVSCETREEISKVA